MINNPLTGPSMRALLSSPLVTFLINRPIGLLISRGSPTGGGRKGPPTKVLPAGGPAMLCPRIDPSFATVGRFPSASRDSLSRTTFYPCRYSAEHLILLAPGGDSETASED